ncbi:MAG: endonuclease/exonuclease/phosphatase family protein [Novosphingobium sp.]
MSKGSGVASSLLRMLLLAGCGLMLGISLLGAVSYRADSTNIVAPYWLALGLAILCVIAWFSRRAARSAALALLLGYAAMAVALLGPLIPGSASASDATRIRVVSFNMYKANPDPDAAMDWIIGQDADFVILLEAFRSNLPAVARLRQHYPYSYNCAGSGYCSTVILARQPAKDVWPLASGDPENRQTLSAVAAHFEIAGRTIPITGVHFDRPWPLGQQEQYWGELSNAAATVGRRGILAGDFNSAPWTFAMRRLSAGGELRLASGAMGTWPTNAPVGVLRLPLDQVYLGPCLDPVSVRRGPALGSDHFPIVTDIDVGDCGGG